MESSLKPHLLRELMPMVLGNIFELKVGWFHSPLRSFVDSISPEHLRMFNFYLAGKEIFRLFARFLSSKLYVKFIQNEADLYHQPFTGEELEVCHRFSCPFRVKHVFLKFVIVLCVDETVHEPGNPVALRLLQNKNISYLKLSDGFDNARSVVESWKLVHTLDSSITFYEKLNEFGNTSTDRVLAKLDTVILRGTAAEFEKAFSKRNLRPLPTNVQLHFWDSGIASIRSSMTSLDDFEVEHLKIHQKDKTIFGRPQMYAVASIAKCFTYLSTFHLDAIVWKDASLRDVGSITQVADAFLQSDFGPDRSVEINITQNITINTKHVNAFINKMMNTGFARIDYSNDRWICTSSVPGKILKHTFVMDHSLQA
uniref:Beta-lactamase domain-containing protein n=1 Tax=Panagrellus redivivus TaxID=6233 RepID=A0A7E4VDC1_PANRE